MTPDPVEVIRIPLAAVAYGSWAPEEQRPDARIALAELTQLQAERDRMTEVVEAAKMVRGNDRAWTTADYEAYRYLQVALLNLDEVSP